MQALDASLKDNTQAAPPNPNFDLDKNPSSLDNYEQAIEAAESSTSSSALHIVTPLIYSEILSQKTGHNIYCKLDALQPSGSFKIRGVGRVCKHSVEKYGTSAHLVCSSGGNAGLAAATAAKALGVRCTVYVPESAEEAVKATLRALGAVVIVAGQAWDNCDLAARQAVEAEEEAVYVHPFVGEDLVDGHASIIDEIYEQLGQADKLEASSSSTPDMIVVATGGGGFLNGILRGIARRQSTHPTDRPKVVSIQDFGADSFSQSMNVYHEDPEKNANAHVVLPAITSLATSMGAKKCSASTLEAARKYTRYGTVDDETIKRSEPEASSRSGRYFAGVVLEDAISGSAAWQFNRDHGYMVEMACGAALAPAYQSERLLKKLVDTLPQPKGKKNIVLIACGGSKIDPEMLEKYEKTYGTQEGTGRIEIDGIPI
jgi:L-serine/L-threonine ammonia-lyase